MKRITWTQLNLHASLCDICTDKYSYSITKEMHGTFYWFILRQLATAAIYICMGIASFCVCIYSVTARNPLTALTWHNYHGVEDFVGIYGLSFC